MYLGLQVCNDGGENVPLVAEVRVEFQIRNPGSAGNFSRAGLFVAIFKENLGGLFRWRAMIGSN